MLLKVLQIQSLAGEKGNYQCGNILHKATFIQFPYYQVKKFNMIQVNTFPSLVTRLHPRAECLVMFGHSLGLH